MLRVLGLHAGETPRDILNLRGLETLACDMQIPDSELGLFLYFQHIKRLRFVYRDTYGLNALNRFSPFYLKSLALFLKQRSDGNRYSLESILHLKGIEHEASSDSSVSTLARCRSLNTIQMNNLLSTM